MSSLGTGDVVVLVAYFVILCVVSSRVSKSSSRNSNQQEESSGGATEAYFLAERSVSWWAVAASLFASNIGSEHFIGLAGSAAKGGVAVGWYEVGAIPVVLSLGLIFLPIYLTAQVQTTPDYLEKRYGGPCRTIVVAVSLVVYIFSRVSATLFAGQIILVQVLDVGKWFAVVLLVSFTAMYTVVGGLEAVIYTEALQTVVLLVGGVMVITFSMGEVGGWQGLVSGLENMTSDDVEDEFRVQENFLHFFRSSADPVYPWTGFLFGFFVIAPWYWCVDQVIVQRALAAKNVAHGQLGCVVAAGLKFLPFFMMVLPGLCARVIVYNRLSLDELRAFDFDHAYPWLVLNVIPMNARGIIIASMLSSLMSALASTFNSCATLFSLNIWKEIFPNTSEQSLVRVGRVTVVAMAILSLLWLPVMHLLGNSLFLIIQKPPAYLSPPILSVYLWGMLSTRPNRRAATWTLALGIATGVLRFTFELIEDAVLVGEQGSDGVTDSVQSRKGQLFGLFTSMNFLHFAAITFWIWTMLLFGLSALFARSATYVATGEEPHGQALDALLFRFSLYDELMSAYLDRKKVSTEDLDFDGVVDDSSGIEMRLHNTDTSSRVDSGADSVDDEMFTDLALSDTVGETRDMSRSESFHSVSLQESFSAAPKRASSSLMVGDELREAPCFGKHLIRGVAAAILFFWLVQVVRFA